MHYATYLGMVLATSTMAAASGPITPVVTEAELWRPDTDQPIPTADFIDDFIIDHPVAEDPPRKFPPPRGGFLVKELQQGRTWEVPGPVPTTGPLGSYHSGWRQDGEEPWGDRNFGTMSVASSPTTFPANVNCRLTMTFTDSTGAQFNTTCSGTFIDAETVLTAAHCVYYGVRNGLTVNGLADAILVRPATHQGVDNLGSCNATWVGAATGYTDAAEGNAWGDFDWDVAAIAVDRATGMLTGWHGIAWDGDCNWIEDQTYFNFAYPGWFMCGGTDAAGNPIHHGNDMYFWSGSFDSCPTNTQLRLDTPNPNCFNTTWGGMSGSSAYYLDAENERHCHAVCSNQPNDQTWANYTKLWGAIADWILDDVVTIARGTTFDLQSLDMNQSGQKQINANAYDMVNGLSVLTTNPTNDSDPTTDWPMDVRFSDNDFISPTDTLLLSGTFNWTFDAMSSFMTHSINVQIPINTPTGNYFIGAIAGDDNITGNNATNGWDALQVAVTAVSEVQAIHVTPLGNELDVGVAFPVDWLIKNNGAAIAGGLHLRMYASLNENITGSDVLLHEEDLYPIPSEGFQSGTWWVDVPEELVGQDWYIGIIIDDPYDVIPDNNTVASGWAVAGVDRPYNEEACYSLPLQDGTHAFDTSWALTNGDTHDECQYDGQTYNDVWWYYTSPISGTLTVSTCEDLGGSADYDTDIVVYEDLCTDLTLLSCNDDDDFNTCGGPPDYHSTVQVEVAQGGLYWFRVGGYSALDSGTGELLVDVRPSNDDCVDAIAIGLGNTIFSTVEATTDGPSHPNECDTAGDGGNTADDIWYEFRADCTGAFSASTCDQVGYDSDLVLYEGNCDSLALVACNDDGAGCGGYSSLLEANVQSGIYYLLRVGGWDAGDQGSGTLTLTLECEPNGGDVDGDGDTDIDDLLLLISMWGTNNPDGDLNGDGTVDIDDILILLGDFDG